MNMLGRFGLTSKGDAEPKRTFGLPAVKVKVLENQRLDIIHSKWSYKNLTMDDPKR
jgi:hypothetical protein